MYTKLIGICQQEKKTSNKLYAKGGSAKAVAGYSYTAYPDYIYSGLLAATVYKTLDLAGAACAAKASTCTGINKNAAAKFQLTKDTTLKSAKGKKVYIKGGYDYTSADIYFGNEFWTAKSPYTLSGTLADKKTYKTRDGALK